MLAAMHYSDDQKLKIRRAARAEAEVGGVSRMERVGRVDTMKAGLTGHERVTKVVLAVLIVLDILPLEVGAASAEERVFSV